MSTAKTPGGRKSAKKSKKASSSAEGVVGDASSKTHAARKCARPESPAESYYSRHRAARIAYQKEYNKYNRPSGSRRKKACLNAHHAVFYRFGLNLEQVIVTAAGHEPVYSNPWASGSTQDEGRTEDMLYEETTLALDLHFLELEHRRSKAKEGWVPGYLEALRKLAEEEQKASNKLRRRSLDLGNPPAQDIDLIEQAVTDASNGEDLADVCLYIKHAIQNGSAIITGASVNRKYFEREYGF